MQVKKETYLECLTCHRHTCQCAPKSVFQKAAIRILLFFHLKFFVTQYAWGRKLFRGKWFLINTYGLNLSRNPFWSEKQIDSCQSTIVLIENYGMLVDSTRNNAAFIFCAKRTDNGKLVYGNYLFVNGKHIIMPQHIAAMLSIKLSDFIEQCPEIDKTTLKQIFDGNACP